MDYCDIFRPLFSYAVHLKLALERRPGCVTSNRIKQDLAEIIRRIRTTGDGDPHFEYAWFAVICWLKELLGTSPETQAIAGSLPLAENYGSSFYQRLNRLLLAARNRPRERELVRVYWQCLELGFRGYYARHEREEERAKYLACCVEVLGERGANEEADAGRAGEDAALPAIPAAGRMNFAAVFLRAAGWMLPILIPVALYLIFADSLGQIYQGILK